MFARDYRWSRRDRRWRRLRMREKAERHLSRRLKRLRSVLVLVLCLELTVGIRQLWASEGAGIHFLRREESCCVEWVGPHPGDGEQDSEQDIYGIRLNPDSMEIQFYHHSRKLLTAE